MKQLILFPFDLEPVVLPDLDSAVYVHFESIDPEQNRYRFYTITWQKTLWGEWTIRTTWGRIGGVGRSRVAYFESELALREALPAVIARRIERGYVQRGVSGMIEYLSSRSVDACGVHELVALQPNVYVDKWTA
jgi:predicted DNA-binding WGR domain protein